MRNGVLLDRAESDGYDLLITTDQSIQHQQNLSRRRLSMMLILDNSWPRIQPHISAIISAIPQTRPGQLTVVPIPAST